MRWLVCLVTAGIVVFVGSSGSRLVAQAPSVSPPTSAANGRLSIATRSLVDVRRSLLVVDQMLAARTLTIADVHDDTGVPGRQVRTMTQSFRGVPVVGGSVTMEVAGSQPVAMFGTIYRDVDVDVTPALTPDDAARVASASAGAAPMDGRAPSLVILPGVTGHGVLAYRVTLRGGTVDDVDATTGRILHRGSAWQREIGTGTGVLGDRKKISTTLVGGTYRTEDHLRPSVIRTFDTRSDDATADRLENDGGSGDGDYDTDADNTWTDGRVVDAHVNTGWTIDYFYKQHHWAGLDNAGGPVTVVIDRHVTDNAFFTPPPYGPDGHGAVVFGDTSSGVPMTALDIVGHELMHGVTEFALQRRTGQSFANVIYDAGLGPTTFTYQGEAFACDTTLLVDADGHEMPFWCDHGRYKLGTNDPDTVNEAFSDVFGTSIEFFYEPPGAGPLESDYTVGEDEAGFGGVRSLENPAAFAIPTDDGGVPYPDHRDRMLAYALVVVDGPASNPTYIDTAPVAFIGGTQQVSLFTTGSDDGGAHDNSTVLSHAFYLAVEGGTDATSGLRATGVGPEHRDQIERAFFRAMTELMPDDADVSTAAYAVYQAAVDLYGAGSSAANAIAGAMIAVGLLLPGPG
ncbi:MAG TPA: M4 family metallopeptidase [Vicinamibacterales bacterium]|jgi:Zn-dependent metalloprotease|nr:M4 family metallopeptidase [Vicinamibacterales bacterium]